MLSMAKVEIADWSEFLVFLAQSNQRCCCGVEEKSADLCFQVRLLLELYRLQGNITRVKINELKPLKPRYEVPDVLIREPPTEP